MLTKRIIACLDVDGGRVVKGVRFQCLRDAGDPADLAAAHSRDGADEVVLLDISATHEGRKTLIDAVQRAGRELFIPFTVGGGIRSLHDAATIIEAGADKISINSAALTEPVLVTAIAERFGSQAVVVAVDAKRVALPGGGYDFAVYVNGGRNVTGRMLREWLREAEDRGAGEILLTSMDRDGTGAGFDCELTAAAAQAVHIPVIASGGAGGPQHFVEVFEHGCADAALAASIFHFGLNRIADLKQELRAAGVPVRLPC